MKHKGCICLCFHYISDNIDFKGVYKNCGITTDKFISVISTLLSLKWKPLPAEQLYLQCSSGEDFDDNYFLITFDDGFSSTVTNALPILKKYGVPAIWFIPGGFIEKKSYPFEYFLTDYIYSTKDTIQFTWQGEQFTFERNRISNDEVYLLIKSLMTFLTPEEQELLLEKISMGTWRSFCSPSLLLDIVSAKRLADDPGMTIGAHGYTHVPWTVFPEKVLYEEISKSISTLEMQLNVPVMCAAFPYGVYQEEYGHLLSDMGIKIAFTTSPGLIQKKDYNRLLFLPRYEIRMKTDLYEILSNY